MIEVTCPKCSKKFKSEKPPMDIIMKCPYCSSNLKIKSNANTQNATPKSKHIIEKIHNMPKKIIVILCAISVILICFISCRNNNPSNIIPAGTPLSTVTPETSTTNEYTLMFGELLDIQTSGGTYGDVLVIKADMSSAYSNKAIIKESFMNIENIIQEQNIAGYSSIDYWAIATMVDGSKSKVISFTVPSDMITKIKSGSLSRDSYANELQEYWVHPALN